MAPVSLGGRAQALSRHKRQGAVIGRANANGAPATKKRVLVAGSTGYIGKNVVRELVDRGHEVVAIARDKSGVGGKDGPEEARKKLEGAEVRFGDCTDPESLDEALEGVKDVDVAVSCLASRFGGVEDSWRVEYEAPKNLADKAKVLGADRYLLLSAICVQKPELEFQRAKLALEEHLQGDNVLQETIVRPTAFFKSLGGQVETVQKGWPFIVFGDGNLASCKPISEQDLSRFMAECIEDESTAGRVLPIGGPGKALSAREQGQILFKLLSKEERFLEVPIQIMDGAVALLDRLRRAFPSLTDTAEFARIGRYYAKESMLYYDQERACYDPDKTPSYGTDTLEDFFRRAINEGMEGQELGEQAVLPAQR